MRTAFAVALGIVVGGAGVLLVTAGSHRASFDSSSGAPRPSPATSAVASTSSNGVDGSPSSAAASVPIVAAARPTTPVYDRRPEEPRPIYRCRADGRTTYSNTPCRDGSVVEDSSAVAGFDTRPSAALERLVADGRADPTVAAYAPGVAGANVSPGPPPSSSCATMRRQIVDIDNLTRYPNSRGTLDYWRGVRQDIRTTMARDHC